MDAMVGQGWVELGCNTSDWAEDLKTRGTGLYRSLTVDTCHSEVIAAWLTDLECRRDGNLPAQRAQGCLGPARSRSSCLLHMIHPGTNDASFCTRDSSAVVLRWKIFARDLCISMKPARLPEIWVPESMRSALSCTLINRSTSSIFAMTIQKKILFKQGHGSKTI